MTNERYNQIREFFGELRELMIKYDVSIGHEDSQGAFFVERWSEHNWEWLYEARPTDSTPELELMQKLAAEEKLAAEQRAKGLIA